MNRFDCEVHDVLYQGSGLEASWDAAVNARSAWRATCSRDNPGGDESAYQAYAAAWDAHRALEARWLPVMKAACDKATQTLASLS